MTADADAREVSCATCGAPAGEPCEGVQLGGSHSARVDAWQRHSRGEGALIDRQRSRAVIAEIRNRHGWRNPSLMQEGDSA